MMIFHLKGELGELFGEKWELNVKTIAEGIRAMFVNTKGKMEEYFRKHGQDYFFVKDGEYYLGGKEEFKSPSSTKNIVISPVIKGSGAAAKIIAGVVLMAVAFFVLGPAGFATGKMIFAMMGASLILGGVVELMTPVPKGPEEAERNESFFFNNGVNSVQQNIPIPVGYGKMIVYGQPISVELKNIDIKAGSISYAAGQTPSVIEQRVCTPKAGCYTKYVSS